MLRSLYTAASGMAAQELKMDVISNNLANAGTVGFKKERAEFEDLLSDTMRVAQAPNPSGGNQPVGLQVGLGVRPSSTSRSMAQGDLQNTNNQTDVAIQGDGFLRVQQANGQMAFTRAGNLRVDATGRIVTQHGEIVQPGITVPAGTTQLTIGSDGTTTALVAGNTNAQELGVIELATFVNPAGMQNLGNNLLGQTAASGDPLILRPGEQNAGTLAQGYLESANVKAVDEMIDMITTQRAYELNSKVVEAGDEMLQRLTSLR
jgi:flagellar basal-body rod protein FlgG